MLFFYLLLILIGHSNAASEIDAATSEPTRKIYHHLVTGSFPFYQKYVAVTQDDNPYISLGEAYVINPKELESFPEKMLEEAIATYDVSAELKAIDIRDCVFCVAPFCLTPETENRSIQLLFFVSHFYEPKLFLPLDDDELTQELSKAVLKNFGNPKFKKEAFVGEKPADIYHIPRLEEQNAGLMASISLTTDGPNQFEIIAHETVKAWQDFWDRRNRSSMCKWLGCYSSREDEE